MTLLIDKDYEIVSVESTDPPRDMVGTGWFCYVIEQGENTIRGYRQGDREAVTKSVEETVARLNERRYGKSGRVHVVITSKSGKSKSK